MERAGLSHGGGNQMNAREDGHFMAQSTPLTQIECRFCSRVRFLDYATIRAGTWISEPCKGCGKTRADELVAGIEFPRQQDDRNTFLIPPPSRAPHGRHRQPREITE